MKRLISDKKLLYIIRHAKSSWDESSLADIDRSLKEKGVKDAYEIAARLKSRGDIPDKIISSPAVRAFHTAVIFSRILGIPDDRIEISGRLYMAGSSEILSFIREVPDDIHSLMIFGHNPGFTGLANILSGRPVDNIPTCGYVCLAFNTDSWAGIGKKLLTKVEFDFPANP